jgi:hypothetical protein
MSCPGVFSIVQVAQIDEDLQQYLFCAELLCTAIVLLSGMRHVQDGLFADCPLHYPPLARGH